MWETIVVIAIVSAAFLYTGKHYLQKLSGMRDESSDHFHGSGDCCSSCDCASGVCASNNEGYSNGLGSQALRPELRMKSAVDKGLSE